MADRANPKNEAEFRRFVMAHAREHLWRIHTDPDLRFRMGDRGFPDLVLARGTVVLFRELKAEGKYLKPDQDDWRLLLEGASLNYGVWRPTDWAKIEEELA